MRSIWNGSISFGLVSIPVKLMNATENHSISFRQIHVADGGRIRYHKVCELDEEEIPASETVKAYEDADGTVIPVTDEDLASLPLPTAKTIEIEGFVPASAIDPLQLDSAYYLSANGVPAAKPYALLREALRRSGKVAVAKYALRGRERLGMLRVVDDVIAMHGLLWPDEIRAPEGVAPDSGVKIRDAELDLADALMNTLGDADLDALRDDYREAVEELVTAKAAGEPVGEAEGEEPEGKVIDLMAALESSVRAAQESHGEGEGHEGEGHEGEGHEGEVADVHPIGSRRGGGAKKSGASAPGKRAAPKKTAAKKTAPRKTAAKKTTAKKATARKTAAKGTAGKAADTGGAAKKGAAKKTAGGARKRTSA
ncbi:Ku protein [Streptomyces sp. NBC_00059]|uniref:non-homologous end joining protein Ku n=1 Tax=Streptomyces sp. NBC_00059 TaxID=2975635 RepID=UPI0022553F18|nr:Ku protein [Streptomyces sp. NBC_00059]MCX5416604.1 Ku protein [Streptomyces sp. NBC_00059]